MLNRLFIEIPLPPRSKKNSQRLIKAKGRIIPIPSKAYKDYETACKPYLSGVVAEPINEPVTIKCIYYMPTRRACDLVNMLEATLDILVHYKVIADDNYKIAFSHDGSRVFYDKDNPRTEITITEVQDESL